MSHNDDVEYNNEGTFKTKLPKLYKLVQAEADRLKIDLTPLQFDEVIKQGDLIDISYSNDEKMLTASFKGGEKHGYKVLQFYLDYDIDDDCYFRK